MYKARLLTEPVAALVEQGIATPAGVTLRAVEADDARGYLFVPPEPANFEAKEPDDVAGYWSTSMPPPPPGVATFGRVSTAPTPLQRIQPGVVLGPGGIAGFSLR